LSPHSDCVFRQSSIASSLSLIVFGNPLPRILIPSRGILQSHIYGIPHSVLSHMVLCGAFAFGGREFRGMGIRLSSVRTVGQSAHVSEDVSHGWKQRPSCLILSLESCNWPSCQQEVAWQVWPSSRPFRLRIIFRGAHVGRSFYLSLGTCKLYLSWLGYVGLEPANVFAT